VSSLHALGGDVEAALEHVNVPTYVIDAHGVIRWLNRAAQRLVGDAIGRQFTSVVAPEAARLSREIFAQKLAGTAQLTDAELVLLNPAGERFIVEVSSVPLKDGERVVGIFGQVSRLEEERAPAPRLGVTPRQLEVLRLLEQGRSTEQIAQHLHLSPETVRNHIRRLLRTLGVHSRLEAVAVARREHLLPD
jgi:PAS domain S-box-containing protein